MEYRINHKTGVIYSRDEYLHIELNWGIFRPMELFEETWEDLDPLPITTEEERRKLQYIYADSIPTIVTKETIHQKILHDTYNRHISHEPADIFGDSVPARFNMGRPHFSGNPQADQRELDNQQTDI